MNEKHPCHCHKRMKLYQATHDTLSQFIQVRVKNKQKNETKHPFFTSTPSGPIYKKKLQF